MDCRGCKKNHTYKPNIIFKGKEPIDFSCVELTQFSDYEAKNFDSISQVLEEYYASKKMCIQESGRNPLI